MLWPCFAGSLTGSVGCMKTGVTTSPSVFIVCGLGLVLAFAFGRACAPSPEKKDWVSLSRMSFGTRTNAGLVIPTVNVIVSNLGPQKILFGLGWFECRTKGDGAWLAAGNARADPLPMRGLLSIPSRSSITMTMDIKPTVKPEDRMTFCVVDWIEREGGLNPMDRVMNELCTSFNLNWTPRFTQPVTEHRAFSANIEFADYFYEMYWHRSNWTNINTNFVKAYGSRLGIANRQTNDPCRVDPGSDEWNARQAFIVFWQFCR
jgi:hypothetical protein